MSRRKLPYLPLYIQDFMTDEKLSECSAESTGVYIRIMCLMHKTDEYGKILLKQKDKQTDKQILNFASKLAKHFPYNVDVIFTSLEELIDTGVLIIDGDYLIQKRMVRDETISCARAVSGSKGGKKTQKSKNNFAKAKSEANTESEIDNDITVLSTSKEINIAFDEFWDLYDKKRGEKEKLTKKWNNLSDAERVLIMEYIPKYKLTTPDKQYRKDPETFLNQKTWTHELIGLNGKEPELFTNPNNPFLP